MNIATLFSIPASGLDAQRERLNIISSNLANIDSTETPEGGPYRRKDVIFSAVPLEGKFEALLNRKLDAFKGVKVTKIISDPRPFKRVFQPNHPGADAEGYVEYPNINAMEEMVNMISALRSYEANITVLKSARSMAAKALEIGR
ncbi:flagellar basal body rod protein FlgC [Nitrospira defluvii]|nr:flagellar basal body rod protein FlgC [Nitrospira defluvii]